MLMYRFNNVLYCDIVKNISIHTNLNVSKADSTIYRMTKKV